MKTIVEKPNGGAYDTTFIFTSKNGNSAYLTIATDPSNCKLSYIHSVGTIQRFPDEERKEAIDYLLKYCKGYVILNTIVPEVRNFLIKTYPTYYHHEVPVGYNNGFQYNICIKNTINPNGNCKDPIVKKVQTKAELRSNLIKVLRKHKRKTDWVEEFLQTIPEDNTEG